MTQIWPGFGEAPVPTLLSIICKPEAVVMVFPAVWAAAVVVIDAGMAKTAIEIAASIGIVACGKRRILGYLLYGSDACLAQCHRRCQPANPRKYAGQEIPARRSHRGRRAIYHAARCSRAVAGAASSVMTENLASCTVPKLVEIATSAASRPRAITMRPIRG